jgi:hypothetical protein
MMVHDKAPSGIIGPAAARVDEGSTFTLRLARA